jgi:hypothetical protein
MRRYPLTSRVICGDHIQMGKYLGYAILVIGVIFVLEWFQIVDVPFFEIPDFMSVKKDMIHSTEDVLEQMK